MTKITISVGASALTFGNPVVNEKNTVVYAGVKDGTLTAGTLTVNARVPNSTVFETPKDSDGNTLNTIDLAAPETLNLYGPIEAYEFTISGFTGTATEIFIGLNSFN